jgi:hypothetical protein
MGDALIFLMLRAHSQAAPVQDVRSADLTAALRRTGQ